MARWPPYPGSHGGLNTKEKAIRVISRPNPAYRELHLSYAACTMVGYPPGRMIVVQVLLGWTPFDPRKHGTPEKVPLSVKPMYKARCAQCVSTGEP